MNFGLTPEQQALREAIEEFVERYGPNDQVRQWDMARHYPYEFFDQLASNGWTALSVPQEYGGMGADALSLTLVAEAIGRYSSDLGNDFAMDCWGATNLIHLGTEAQRREYLPKLARGEVRFSISITEPNSGSDAASLSLQARRHGNGWVLNGQKVFATGAHRKNNIIILAARTSRAGRKQDGITVFLVPNVANGLSIVSMPTLGRRIAGTCELYFDDVFVTESQVLGEVDKGWEVLTGKHLIIERIMCAGSYIGNAQGALDRAVAYARERVQFDRPIASFQVIRHNLAQLQTEIDAARLLAYRAAWLFQEGKECAREAAMAKLLCSETSMKVTTYGMQVLGGYSQLPEYDMERHWRNAKVSTIGGGTSEIQRTVIARGMGL